MIDPPSSRTAALPAELGLVLDPDARRIDDGRVLVGGSPLRLVRLSAGGASVLDAWSAGDAIGASAPRQKLARRLLEVGLAHPRPARGSGPFTPADIAGNESIEAHVRTVLG